MTDDQDALGEIGAVLVALGRRLEALGAAAGVATSRKPAGEWLDESLRSGLGRLDAVFGIGAEVPADQLPGRLLDRVRQGAGADCAVVFVVGDGPRLVRLASLGCGAAVAEASLDAGIVGRAMAERDIVVAHAGHHAEDALLAQLGLARAVAVPVGRDRPVGVLLAGRRRPVDFTLAALETVVLVAYRFETVIGCPAPMASGPALLVDLDLERTGTAVAREAARRTGARDGLVLMRGSGGGLRVVGSAGCASPEGAMDPATEPFASALASGQVWTAPAGDRRDGAPEILGTPITLIAPLVVDRAVVGLLALGGEAPVAVSPLAGFLPEAAVALRNARLHAEVVAALAEVRALPPAVPVPAPARDFGSLLAVVLGRIAALRERLSDPAALAELTAAEEATWRAAESVRGLVGYGRGRRETALAPLDLAALVRAVFTGAEAQWPRPGGGWTPVRLALDPVPPVRGSAEDLREALGHLLDNAAEAAPEGAGVTVRSRWDGGQEVELAVEDRGAGMDETTRARAVEPFFSTRGAGRLGLGLAVVHAIVTRHRGTMALVSAPGLGTTVRLGLPTAASTLGASHGRVPARVLIVEDDVSVREAVVEAIAQQGHETLTAADIGEALALARRERVDAVITDLALPSGSGLEVARGIRRLRADCAVVVITGWPERLDPATLRDAGVDGVIEKPVGLGEVRAALGVALSGRRSTGG